MLRCLLLVAVFFAAHPAHAVTATSYAGDVEKVDALTSGAANRARADVAIRRIKTLLVNGEASDEGEAIERIKDLQKDLRGQK